MTKTIRRLLPGLLLAASAWAGAECQAPNWCEIDVDVASGLVNASGQLLDEHGTVLTDGAVPPSPLVPDCAFGPAKVADGVPIPYYFFYQQGSDPDALVIFHSGGGACWEDNTCGSAILNGLDPDVYQSTYFPNISDSVASLTAAKGIFDTTDLDNPYAQASKVYIPYCTGDVGWGNRDTQYHSPIDGSLYRLHHRGYANIRAVTQWLRRQFQTADKPQRVLVAGTSAGGYAAIGAVLPEVAKLLDLRHTDLSVIGDSANGIVTDSFLSVAAASWGFNNTLPSYMTSALNRGAAGVGARIYLSAIREFPSVRFSQYQNAFDLVQTQFFNIMQNVNTPSLWSDPTTLSTALASWTSQMRTNTLMTAVSPAYRFYTAAGYEHGVLQYVPPNTIPGFCSDVFSTETSGTNRGSSVPLTDWASDMFNFTGRLRNTGDWVNATCLPNCDVPPVCPVTPIS